jgi:hypothetical protein
MVIMETPESYNVYNERKIILEKDVKAPDRGTKHRAALFALQQHLPLEKLREALINADVPEEKIVQILAIPETVVTEPQNVQMMRKKSDQSLAVA